MTKSEIERRFAAIESELSLLKASRDRAQSAHPLETLEKIHGLFANDDAAFREATRLGRKWRESFRPRSAKSTTRRK